MELLVQLNSIFVHATEVVARELDGQLLIIPFASEIGNQDHELYTLNDTGRAVWDRLDGKRSLREIIRVLETMFESSNDEIEADVLGLATELACRKMIIPIEKP